MSGSRMGGVLRRALGTVVTLALVGAAIGFYALSPRLSLTSGPGPVTTAEPAPTPTTIQSASPSPPVSTTRTPTRTPESSLNPDLPPGPGGRAPGIRLIATPTAHGAFDVIETVRLAEPVTQLTVAPPDLTSLAGNLKGKQPMVEALKVKADNRPVRLSNATVRRGTAFPIARPADLFELRYRLRGVTVINKPSSAGRALGAVGPLVTGVSEEFPVAITVRGHSVRNLSCPCLPMADWACAAGRAPQVRVNQDLHRRDALVVVQFDVPATRVGAPR